MVVGYGVAVSTQLLVFPLFGLEATLGENLAIGAIFTVVSLGRSYALRRPSSRPSARRTEAAALLRFAQLAPVVIPREALAVDEVDVCA